MEAVRDKLLRCAQSRRWAASLIAGVLASVKAIADATLATFLVTWLIYVLVAVGLVYGAASFWESKTRPGVPTFARPRGFSTQNKRLHEDANARLWSDRGGFLFERRYFFVAAGLPPVRRTVGLFSRVHAYRHTQPVPVVTSGGRTWWAFGDAFFWEAAGYGPQDVHALLRDRERRHERTLDRAHMLFDAEAARKHRRERPTAAMRQAVFARDGGACAECGSTFDIQYDHIIPFALGGSNGIDNLQILCGECNRAKSASI